jgi:hypothetical protein
MLRRSLTSYAFSPSMVGEGHFDGVGEHYGKLDDR